MKKIIYMALVVLMGCKSGVEKNKVEIETITINTSSVDKNKVDISNIFEKGVEIIRLETKDDCLVQAKGKKVCTEKNIFIADKISQKIFMFDWQGKFCQSIGKLGRGGDEYIQLGDFCIVNDSVYVQDAQLDKIVVYPLDGGKGRGLRVNPPIYYSAMFLRKGNLYFITNYSNDYNLIQTNLNVEDRKNFLPYDKTINIKKQNWGLEKYVGQYKDSVLLILSRNDTIYSLGDKGVEPRYIMNYSRNRLPAELLEKNGSEVLRTALSKGYNTGLEQICNMRDYFMGIFAEGTSYRNFLYSKDNRSILLGESFILNDYGQLDVLNYVATDNDELVAAYDALFFKQIWEYILSKNHFRDETERKEVERVAELLRDDDNPVILRFKLKK